MSAKFYNELSLEIGEETIEHECNGMFGFFRNLVLTGEETPDVFDQFPSLKVDVDFLD